MLTEASVGSVREKIPGFVNLEQLFLKGKYISRDK
jgi:hypothetical protein